MYTLMALLGLLATSASSGLRLPRAPLRDPVRGRRGVDALHPQLGALLRRGSFLSLVILCYISDEEIRTELIATRSPRTSAAVILFVPWMPNFIFQVIHTAAPWDTRPRFGVPIQIALGVLGGGSIAVVMLLARRHRLLAAVLEARGA